MATEVTDATRYTTSDWFTANYAIVTDAERQRGSSHGTRQQARFLRNETNNKTKWDQLDNNTRLADRVEHIRRWKEILERTLGELDKEIADLSGSKEELEISLEGLNKPTEINVENLTMREGRRDIDVVDDEVGEELKKEQQLIEAVRRQLQARVDDSFEQLCRLQECRQDILADLQDKNVALDIDIDQYNLTEDSPNISYKPDPTRIPKGTVTPQQWEDFSRHNKMRADAEMGNSRRLREANQHTIQQTANDLKAQQTAVDYAIRKRIHEFERALDELKWQKEQTEDEIAEMLADIRRLEDALRAKIKPMKLAQTRLEHRTYRPGMELCRDNAQYGLTDEVKQLDATQKALDAKMKQCQHELDGLERKLHRINVDIDLKTRSLQLDKQCLDSRSKLKDATVDGLATTDRNLSLTGVTRGRTMIA